MDKNSKVYFINIFFRKRCFFDYSGIGTYFKTLNTFKNVDGF